VLIDKHAHFCGTVPVARMPLAAPEQQMLEPKTEPLIHVNADASEKTCLSY
jgi:hypothetical protein